MSQEILKLKDEVTARSNEVQMANVQMERERREATSVIYVRFFAPIFRVYSQEVKGESEKERMQLKAEVEQLRVLLAQRTSVR